MAHDDWQAKQGRLREFLESYGAADAAYRIDLSERKLFWIDALGLSLVVADCKVLLSYALSNRSIMMAWANTSLTADCGVKQIEGFEDFYSDCGPEDVWEITTAIASAVGAEALYRSPSPQSWVMLGLWNFRQGGAEQFYSGSPSKHVRTVLQRLIEHADHAELAVLLDNYAESFLQMAEHPHKGSDFESALRDAARFMRNSLRFANEGGLKSLRDELRQLEAVWGKLP